MIPVSCIERRPPAPADPAPSVAAAIGAPDRRALIALGVTLAASLVPAALSGSPTGDLRGSWSMVARIVPVRELVAWVLR